ncbi:hypothetical protein Taro_047052 [Colocasia esculenta]|uniref:Uncharacterized protein n=1 Tax=Colocasia esculenta TaxID=4460 RepID=A0A843X6S8_COLES|nr:hypothetical protein [Colocasia esculenta]
MDSHMADEQVVPMKYLEVSVHNGLVGCQERRTLTRPGRLSCSGLTSLWFDRFWSRNLGVGRDLWSRRDKVLVASPRPIVFLGPSVKNRGRHPFPPSPFFFPFFFLPELPCFLLCVRGACGKEVTSPSCRQRARGAWSEEVATIPT